MLHILEHGISKDEILKGFSFPAGLAYIDERKREQLAAVTGLPAEQITTHVEGAPEVPHH